MDGVLPEEFPFVKRASPATPAPAPQPAPARVTPPPKPPEKLAADIAAAPAPPIQRLEPDALIEVACGPRNVYRGRQRRRSPRQAFRAKATYRDDAKPAASGAVQVVNISMFGVRLWSPRPMTVNDRGQFRLELGPVKYQSRLRVVTCAMVEDDGYVIGCEFVANEVAPKRRVSDAA
jgi:hypothetical protein